MSWELTNTPSINAGLTDCILIELSLYFINKNSKMDAILFYLHSHLPAISYPQ